MVEITYWTWEGGNEESREHFHETHPGYRIVETKLASASDYATKIQQAVVSGSELPDILLGETNQHGALFAMDIWEDLSQEPYNAKLEAQFATMDDYIEAAAKVKEQSGGQDFLFASSGLVMEWLPSASTQPNINDAGEIVYTEKITPILEQICALRDAGGLDTFTNWTPQCNAAYADEHYIFYPCANWDITYRIKANDAEGSGNWGLMMPPGGYSHGGTVMESTRTARERMPPGCICQHTGRN